MKQPVDWALLETEYVTGSASYQSLSEEHGVSRTRIGAVARREGWGEKRTDYRRRVRELAAEKRARKDAQAIAELTETADRVARAFAQIAADEKQFCRYIVQEKNGTQTVSEEKLFEKRDIKSLREMTAALKDLIFVIRDLHDMPNMQDRAAMENARRKLEMEEQRARSVREEEEAFGVILIPEAQGENPEEWKGQEEEPP